MKVKAIRIHNVLGIEDIEIAPGRITRLVGRNGSGKSSALAAIGAAFKGGHDASLLRRGAAEGEAVLVLEDDGVEYTVTKKIGPADSPLSVDMGEAGRMSAPKRWLEALIDPLAMNPAAFLAAGPKERVDLLLAALPAKVDGARLEALAGTWVRAVAKLDAPALRVLDTVREMIFTKRRDTGRDGDEAKAAAEALRKSLPTVTGEDPAAMVADARQALGEVRHELAGLNEAARLGHVDAGQGIRERHAAVQREADARLAAALAAARAVHTAEVTAAGETATAQLRAEQEALAERQRVLAAEYGPKIEAGQAQVAALEARAADWQRATGARVHLAGLEGKARAAQAERDRLTAALTGIDAWKAELLQGLPEGLAVRGNDLVVGEIPFDRVNTAERVRIAFALARLRHPRLALILADGLEALDAETLAEVERQVPADAHLIYGHVRTGAALAVETVA